MSQIVDLIVTQIRPGGLVANDRTHFDPNKLKELASSIAEHGLAQPITVRPIFSCSCSDFVTAETRPTCPHCGGDDWLESYEVVAGERRFRAISQILGWATIPALIKNLSDEEASGIMLAENTGREDLDPIEEANAYQARSERFGWDNERLAQAAGVSTERVRRRLTLLRLTQDIQHLVRKGNLPIGHAEAMACLDNNRQRIAVRIFREAKNGLPLSAFREVVSQLLEEQSQDSLFDLENFWIEQVATEELPRSGKRAITGAPTRDDLPSVHIGTRETQAGIIERYIATLLEAGHDAEAAAIGKLYTAMVRKNYLRISSNSPLTQN